MRLTIITMGMAELSRVFRSHGKAGERRLRRKRSPRCRPPSQTIPWTRAHGASLLRGAVQTLGLFSLRTGGVHPFALLRLLE
jgi:hypothetical protein